MAENEAGVNNGGVNEGEGNPTPNTIPQGAGAISLPLKNTEENPQPEKLLSQNLTQNSYQNYDINTLTLLLGILQQVLTEKRNKAKPEDFINVLESVLETAQEQEIE